MVGQQPSVHEILGSIPNTVRTNKIIYNQALTKSSKIYTLVCLYKLNNSSVYIHRYFIFGAIGAEAMGNDQKQIEDKFIYK